jgi:hypothetical protein
MLNERSCRRLRFGGDTTRVLHCNTLLEQFAEAEQQIERAVRGGLQELAAIVDLAALKRGPPRSVVCRHTHRRGFAHPPEMPV